MADKTENWYDAYLKESSKHVKPPPKKVQTVGQLFADQQRYENTPERAIADYGVDWVMIEKAIDAYKKKKIAELEKETTRDKQTLELYYSRLSIQQVLSRVKLTSRQLGLIRKKYDLPGVQKRIGSIQYYEDM